jgi:hypothetical protein
VCQGVWLVPVFGIGKLATMQRAVCQARTQLAALSFFIHMNLWYFCKPHLALWKEPCPRLHTGLSVLYYTFSSTCQWWLWLLCAVSWVCCYSRQACFYAAMQTGEVRPLLGCCQPEGQNFIIESTSTTHAKWDTPALGPSQFIAVATTANYTHQTCRHTQQGLDTWRECSVFTSTHK